MKRILILSPTNKVTGGTELLQQLCFVLRNAGFNAYMCYEEKNYNSEFIIHFESIYHNPSLPFEDSSQNIIVIPETMIAYINAIHEAEPVLWWLSVDNYLYFNKKGKNILRSTRNRLYSKFYYNPKIRQLENLVQSEYAKITLVEKLNINPERIFYLSDYLNDEFLQLADGASYSAENKTDSILYNPAKLSPFMNSLLKNGKKLNWIPLRGFSIDEMHQVLSSSKLYVDFGNHPGKDRIPREAVISGCCLITGMKGSAANETDIPIMRKYKFDERNTDIEKVFETIYYILNNYEETKLDFNAYRSEILAEKDKFKKDAINYFSIKVTNEKQ